MDTTAEEIVFDANGVCNFCKHAEESIKQVHDEARIQWKAGEVPGAIRKGKGQYDCIIGVSGGVDSSYALSVLHEQGVRVLAFSVDNGYNDPKADENIMRLVEGMKVPFIRYTIDLKRFAELQMAFIKAGQKNAEIPTDHILMAATYEIANRYGIKTIVSGGNVATESIMPASWGYNARDARHIRDVYRQMTGKRLRGLPVCGLLKWNWYRWVKGMRIVYVLDYIPYNRDEAIKTLHEKYGYKDYGDKHSENEFTKWFQNFYLYQKFGIDKRKPHYSSMIVSGQMTRGQALERLKETLWYPKFGIEGKVLSYPARPHTDFKTDEKWYRFIAKVVKTIT